MLQAMNPYFILPIALGVSVVLQASLNREMALHYGLATAVLLNAAVFLVLSLSLFALGKFAPQYVPGFLQPKASDIPFSWVYIVPGICGFFLVLGLPWALEKIGPSNAFLILIATQIVVSLAIEGYRTQSLPHSLKMTGAVLVIIGGMLVAKS